MPAENAWTEHVHDTAEGLLLSEVDSWFNGINSNLAGRSSRNFLLYAGGAPAYRKRCDDIAVDGYQVLNFDEGFECE